MADIHQEVTLPAPPAKVFAALTDAKTFSALSGGAPAEIDAAAGGAFSLFGGRIVGRNVELEPGVRIVQAWRAGNWEPGRYSIVSFALAPDGEGTRLTFDQAGHPAEATEHLSVGWGQMYWSPIKAHFS